MRGAGRGEERMKRDFIRTAREGACEDTAGETLPRAENVREKELMCLEFNQSAQKVRQLSPLH
jgi:hypothetical protein